MPDESSDQSTPPETSEPEPAHAVDTLPPPPEEEVPTVPQSVHEEFRARAAEVIEEQDQELRALRERVQAMQAGQKSYAFVFVDLTTGATPETLRPAPVFPQVIEALVEYLTTDYARAYGGRTISFRVASGPGDRAPGEIAVNHRDTIPEAPGALAYHSVTGGVADVELGLDLFASLLEGSESYAVGLSHEILELLGDEGANGWKDRQDVSNESDAEELCDNVQNTFKTMSNGVPMSNFVLPSRFIPGAPGPWDNMGVMQNQTDTSNGYGIVASTPSDPHQVAGLRLARRPLERSVSVRGSLTPLQKKRKSHPHSRTFRRGARL